MDPGSRNSFQTDEGAHRGTPNANRTEGKRGIDHIISAVLMTERGNKQTPVYFVSRALRGPETNYTPMEKLVLALLSASRRLKRYFQAHTVVVITDQPIKQLLSKSEISGRVNGSYVAKESGMVQYLEKVKTLTRNFKEFSIKQVPRSENKKANALSKIASTSFAHLSKQVLVEELKEKSKNEKEVLAVVEEEGHTWMTDICEYLTKEILPEDKNKARAVRHKAARYTVINGTLYKKSFLGP
ncbi:reverse transcriptase domain-containing protein [Tanacetum coccineum]